MRRRAWLIGPPPPQLAQCRHPFCHTREWLGQYWAPAHGPSLCLGLEHLATPYLHLDLIITAFVGGVGHRPTLSTSRSPRQPTRSKPGLPQRRHGASSGVLKEWAKGTDTDIAHLRESQRVRLWICVCLRELFHNIPEACMYFRHVTCCVCDLHRDVQTQKQQQYSCKWKHMYAMNLFVLRPFACGFTFRNPSPTAPFCSTETRLALRPFNSWRFETAPAPAAHKRRAFARQNGIKCLPAFWTLAFS